MGVLPVFLERLALLREDGSARAGWAAVIPGPRMLQLARPDLRAEFLEAVSTRTAVWDGRRLPAMQCLEGQRGVLLADNMRPGISCSAMAVISWRPQPASDRSATT